MAAAPTRRRLLGTLLLAASGLSALGLHGHARAADELGQDSEPPALAAQFQVTLARPGRPPQQQTWQLSRSGALITWHKGPATEELWHRDRSGIRLERVLRSERHVITYSAGELRTLEVAVDWATLGSLFPATNLALLKPQAPLRASQPQHWAGRIGAEQVDLLWDPVALLPIRLARKGRNGRVLFKRVALHASAPADWPRAGAGTEDFQRLDAADFGDMDYNPVVRRARAEDERAGWRQPHHE